MKKMGFKVQIIILQKNKKLYLYIKDIMNKHYRKSIKKRSLKNLRGGWSFFNQSVAPSQECDPNNLSMIKDYTGMATNYKNCCF